MDWIVKFFTSSLGKKVVMSLSGLFLCQFLVVHMAGNMQLLIDDGGLTFNAYAYNMTHSPIIKTVSYLLYFSIILHAVQGLILAFANRGARKSRYASTSSAGSSFASRNMGILGSILLLFIVVHMKSFWFEMHWGEMGVDANGMRDLYTVIVAAFSNPLYVLFYIISLAALSFHLWHGFQSAFQTLGVNHSKYTPIIKLVGCVFAIIVPALFALQPLFIFFKNM